MKTNLTNHSRHRLDYCGRKHPADRNRHLDEQLTRLDV